MALYGNEIDMSLFRHLNRELLHDIITQQVAFYKVNIEKTKPNIYGESVDGMFLSEPTLFNCLIKRGDPQFQDTDLGKNFNRTNTFYFLRDDLVDANAYPELGDVIFYYGDYYEIEQVNDNQLFTGKDPLHNYATNPVNPALEEYGWSVSIGCVATYIPADKLGISIER